MASNGQSEGAAANSGSRLTAIHTIVLIIGGIITTIVALVGLFRPAQPTAPSVVVTVQPTPPVFGRSPSDVEREAEIGRREAEQRLAQEREAKLALEKKLQEAEAARMAAVDEAARRATTKVPRASVDAPLSAKEAPTEPERRPQQQKQVERQTRIEPKEAMAPAKKSVRAGPDGCVAVPTDFSEPFQVQQGTRLCSTDNRDTALIVSISSEVLSYSINGASYSTPCGKGELCGFGSVMFVPIITAGQSGYSVVLNPRRN